MRRILRPLDRHGNPPQVVGRAACCVAANGLARSAPACASGKFLVALALTLAIVACGCRPTLTPGLSLRDARLAEGPVLVRRGSHFYLRYRRELEAERLTLRSLLYSTSTPDGALFFFSVPMSHPEWGELVESPLAAYAGYEDFARQGKVYWLDPDGTRHDIPIRAED